MTWIFDTYQTVRGEVDINTEACCTGKFIGQGGIKGRTESTGLGVFYTIKELMGMDSFCKEVKLSPGLSGKKFVVQGFGNVGFWAAKFIKDEGGIITTVVEYNSAIHNENGIDVEDAKRYM